MPVMVMYKDAALDIVESSLVDELISLDKIKKLLRSEGWATVGVDPMRGAGGDYEGPDRRESPAAEAGKKQIRALANSRKYLDGIINSIADPVLVKDGSHRWVFVNEALCSLVAHDRGELLGKSDYDLFPKKETDIFWSQDEIVLTTGEVSANEEKVTDARGVVHTVVTRRSLFTDEAGEKFVVGIMRDMTVQEKEKELGNIHKLESSRVLVGGIAHDFNNVLMGIMGNISLARISSADKIGEFLEEAEKAAFRMQELSRQLFSIVASGPAAAHNGKTKVASGKGKVLIMDDEEVIRQVSGDMLKRMGYEVEAARDGSEAIDIYAKAFHAGTPFNVIIMDLTIPGGMGGKDAIRKLIEIDPNVKAIVSSGYSNDPVMSNFRDYGFSGIMEKPFKIRELSEQIRKIMGED